jgi:hypothetical protein
MMAPGAWCLLRSVPASLSPPQAQSIRLRRQAQLLRGPVELALATVGIPPWASSAFPPCYSVSASGALFVDAREFQRRHRGALETAVRSHKVRKGLRADVGHARIHLGVFTAAGHTGMAGATELRDEWVRGFSVGVGLLLSRRV